MLQVNINYYIWLILTCNINITNLVSYRGCQLMYRPTSWSTLSVYISVTTSFKCQTKCQLSVDSIGSVSAMYQWAINQVSIRYRWCNVGSTVFITCTNFFSNLIPKALIPDWSVTCTKSQAIFTYRPTSRSSVGWHINCYWSSGGRESVKSRSMSYGSWSRYRL